MSIYSTGANADTVNGAGGTIILTNSPATVNGSNDTFYFAGNDSATVSGGAENFDFGAIFGQSSIAGFDSTDVIQFSKSDFQDFQDLQSHIQQPGTSTTITLNSNTLTLTNVNANSLTTSEFRFV